MRQHFKNKKQCAPISRLFNDFKFSDDVRQVKMQHWVSLNLKANIGITITSPHKTTPFIIRIQSICSSNMWKVLKGQLNDLIPFRSAESQQEVTRARPERVSDVYALNQRSLPWGSQRRVVLAQPATSIGMNEEPFLSEASSSSLYIHGAARRVCPRGFTANSCLRLLETCFTRAARPS